MECPISIVPAGHNTTMTQSANKLPPTVTTENLNAPTDKRKKVE